MVNCLAMRIVSATTGTQSSILICHIEIFPLRSSFLIGQFHFINFYCEVMLFITVIYKELASSRCKALKIKED